MLKFRQQTIAILIAVSLSGTAWAEAEVSAQQFVEGWLALLDRGHYAESYGATAPLFKNQINATRWSASAYAARLPFGTFSSRELISAIYQHAPNGAPPGDYIVFQYSSEFGDNKRAIETITPMLVNGRWQISGYYIRAQ